MESLRRGAVHASLRPERSAVKAMPKFDKTYTDPEFRQEIQRADAEWMAKHARPEADLDVESLRPGILSRIVGLFMRPRTH